MSYPSYDLTFSQFQTRSWRRAMTAEKFAKCRDWTLSDWVTAVVGELGEAANIIKKVNRGDFALEEVKPELAKELVDAITYLDLLMSKVGAQTGDELEAKFNDVSKRIGYTE